MKRLMIITVGAISGWSMGAAAQTPPENFYVRVDTGGSFSTNAGQQLNSDIGSSAIVGAGVGVKVLPFLRTDLTLAYRPSYSFDAFDTTFSTPGNPLFAKGDVKVLTALVNAYYDFPAFAGFAPYVGAGIGAARNEVGTTTVVTSTGATAATIAGTTTMHLAWQVSAGVSYSVAPAVALDIGYRYLDAGEGKTADTANTVFGPVSGITSKGNIRAHEIQAGIRVGF